MLGSWDDCMIDEIETSACPSCGKGHCICDELMEQAYLEEIAKVESYRTEFEKEELNASEYLRTN